MESYEQCGQGRSYCSLCTLDTIHKLFFVTRLIINTINKVQWVDYKLENVLVSLHSLKTIIFKEWRVTWTFSYTYDFLLFNLRKKKKLITILCRKIKIFHIYEQEYIYIYINNKSYRRIPSR